MFSRVVSNFRKKTRKIAQNKSLSTSLSSPELIHRRANYKIGKKVTATNSSAASDCDFDYDDIENILSISTTCKSDAKDSSICDKNDSGCISKRL